MIDIIAPAGKIHHPSELELIEKQLNTWGFQARFSTHILNNIPIQHRLEDFKTALSAPDSDIIWCYRGGSGASELLPFLTDATPPQKQKIFLGFSDITALHIFLNQEWGWKTYHGPNAHSLKHIDSESINRLKLLFNQHKTQPIPDLKLTGKIIGGNLSIISHSLGTPYQIKTDHKNLFLEDINEPAYKIRRMLTQLKQAGLFENIQSLIVGEFNFSPENPAELNLINELLTHISRDYLKPHIPVYITPHIGHGACNYVVEM